MWFETALQRVARTIRRLNPPGPQRRIYPGYKCGHATKVLSIYVRDLVLFSRYYSEADARRIEQWLYCPIDGLVIDRLRRVGSDPTVNAIREVEEAEFWRLQEQLAAVYVERGPAMRDHDYTGSW